MLRNTQKCSKHLRFSISTILAFKSELSIWESFIEKHQDFSIIFLCSCNETIKQLLLVRDGLVLFRKIFLARPISFCWTTHWVDCSIFFVLVLHIIWELRSHIRKWVSYFFTFNCRFCIDRICSTLGRVIFVSFACEPTS